MNDNLVQHATDWILSVVNREYPYSIIDSVESARVVRDVYKKLELQEVGTSTDGYSKVYLTLAPLAGENDEDQPIRNLCIACKSVDGPLDNVKDEICAKVSGALLRSLFAHDKKEQKRENQEDQFIINICTLPTAITAALDNPRLTITPAIPDGKSYVIMPDKTFCETETGTKLVGLPAEVLLAEEWIVGGALNDK